MSYQIHFTNFKNRFTTCLLSLALMGILCVGPQIQATTPSVVTLPGSSSGVQIQEALDKIHDGGEVVLLPGTYEIRQPIMLRHDNQTLRGGGVNTILHLADKANCPVVILGAPMNAKAKVTMHLRLADLFIDGNRTNQQVELWHTAVDGSQLNNNGVDVWDVNDATVENVTCCRCRSGGLVTAVVRHLNVLEYTSYDNQFDGLACYLTEDSNFKGLHLYDNLAAGISLDLAFNHNVISDAVLTGNELGIFMRASCNNTFKALTISKSRKYGVFMAQSAAPTPAGWALCPGTECTGNQFDGLTVSSCAREAFLVNNASCINNSIRDARFADNTTGGLKQGDGKPCVVSLALAAEPAPAKSATKPIEAVILPHGVVGALAGH